jgi:DNA-binding MarR family transcriptional regulator
MNPDELSKSLMKILSLKHALFNAFDISSLGLGLNRTQERVLMMAWHKHGAPMRFLSKEAGMEKGSLTTVIDSLEERGLVTRNRDEEDHRSFIVMPTPEGERQAQMIETLFQGHMENLLSKLTKDEAVEFEKSATVIARLIPKLSV